jgi:hypothetical protein
MYSERWDGVYLWFGLIVFMLVVFAFIKVVKERDKVVKERDKALMANEINKLLRDFKEFINGNKSTSTVGDQSAVQRDHPTTYVKWQQLLGIGENDLPQMTEAELNEIRGEIRAAFDGKKEKKGVHPRVEQVLTALCARRGSLYSVKHECALDDMETAESHFQIPDFTLYPDDDAAAAAALTFSSATMFVDVKIVSTGAVDAGAARGFQQALAYACSKLMSSLQVWRDHKRPMRCFGLGTDGLYIFIGHVVACEGKVEFEGAGLCLWDDDDGGLRMEAARVLLYLLSRPPVELGHEPLPSVTVTTSVFQRRQFQLKEVLGTGGFCSVMSAQPEGGAEAALGRGLVAIKRPRYTASYDDVDARQQLQNELEMLETLSDQQHSSIISLAFDHAGCLQSCDGLPCLVLSDVGMPLPQYAVITKKKDRRDLLQSSFAQQLLGALHAAERCGVCHCDLRPCNIIVVNTEEEGAPHTPAAVRFVIIDWGLARESGSSFTPRNHNAGVPYFHPVLIDAYSHKGQAVSYLPEYDEFALKCIGFLFLHSRKTDLKHDWGSGSDTIRRARDSQMNEAGGEHTSFNDLWEELVARQQMDQQ